MSKRFTVTPLLSAIAATALLGGLSGCKFSDTHQETLSQTQAQPALNSQQVTAETVTAFYPELAHAVFADALVTAQALQKRIDIFLSEPTEANLAAAKDAWKLARKPYQQSEVFRFGNAVVDDWEGQLNAWPLDEGLIDYVNTDRYEAEMGNEGASANIIANTSLQVGAETTDIQQITPDLLKSLNEIGGSEANVATGYHAIEFLLWGQDLNGTAPGAGQRPATDYQSGAACTHGHCDRRASYLKAAVDLLVTDLAYMADQWSVEGAYRAQLKGEPTTQVLRKMFFGMGSLSLGELAGERMKVALEANSTEDEQDCFSDNTHNSHFYDAKGIENVYLGRYVRTDGSELQGPALSDLVAKADAGVNTEMRAALATTMGALQTMVDKAEAAENPMKFDMMIAEGNAEGKAIIQASIQALVAQTGLLEKAARALSINDLNPETADHAF
ncbi:MAG: peptidase [Hahellaceae bacterium]|nr:peptidase [Hahellaceae bacterium]